MLASLLSMLCVLLGLNAHAAPEDPFRVEVDDVTLAPGAKGAIRVTVVVPEGFHVYRDMMAVSVTDAGKVKAGEASFPPGLMKDDPASPGTKREQYEEDVLIDLPVTAPAAVGTYDVALNVRYQGCKKTVCYFPGEKNPTAHVIVAGAPAGQAAPAGEEVVAEGQAVDASLGSVGGANPDEETAVIFTGVAGEPNQAKIHVDLQGDWHVNKGMLSFTLVDAEGYTLGEPTLPPGEKSGDPAAGTDREDYTEDLDLVIPISGPPGPATVKIEMPMVQACKGLQLCRMPTPYQVSVPVTIGAAIAAAPAEPATVSPSASSGKSGFAAAQEQGVLTLLLFCFAAGIGVSFTPCVLPMVPITMGLIGARGAGSRFQAVSLAGTYVLGLAAVYTALGVFAGVTGSLFGSQMQSPYLVGAIAIFFVVMGFSMFGFFDVQVPSFIMSRMSGRGGGGYAGALVLGIIGAFLAGPCSGPVVASILALIGKQGQVGLGALLMFAFSLGIGMIFLVTGAANGWLPSRGGWMVTVKKSFGIVLWLGAIYYAAPHLSTSVTALATAAVLLVTGVFSWPSAEDGEGEFMERLRQVYAIGAGLVGAYLLVGTLVHDGFILPPLAAAPSTTSEATVSAGPGIAWGHSEPDAIKEAQASGKLLMIDFTAKWCAACHELEKYTYTDPAVIAASKDFVPVMVDCTSAEDETIKALRAKYGVSGLPTVVFVTPDGRIVGESVVEFIKAPDFLARMKQALEAKG